ncbi:hypothetical protein [Olivibacter sp. XZL3]|uniref:hypothetical protein n=1 Tax=Olivibacter sp. XZL3 TaxID=1735116 RepID=UPI0010663FF9|nr:hypothetical protein [Olivibacter sp. XZL3]
MKRLCIYLLIATTCWISRLKAAEADDKSIEAIYGLWSSKNDRLFEKLSIQKDGFLGVIKQGVNIGKLFKITDYKNGLVIGQGFDDVFDVASGFSFEMKVVSDKVLDLTLHKNKAIYHVRLYKEADYESGAIFAK